MKKRQLAFVLGGGGSRGALQVGALRALIEAGMQPDLLVGTSVGAMNAAYLALHGINLAGLSALEQAWQDASLSCLLNPNHSWLTLRALLDHPDDHAIKCLRTFFQAHGAVPSLRFADIPEVQLALVAADLNTGCPVIYGTNPDHSVLEGLLASTALPPWVMPLENDEKYLVDGGALSNLPVEPALRLGATEIVALDLADPVCVSDTDRQVNRFFNKLSYAVCQRQSELEIALARSHGVLVHQILLRSPASTPIWDFSAYRELIAHGYEITRQELSRWEQPQEILPETLKQMVGVQR
jgi:NTE family protein